MVGMIARVEFLLLSEWYKLPDYVFIYVFSPYFACVSFIMTFGLLIKHIVVFCCYYYYYY
jgi:hypothetical protein